MMWCGQGGCRTKPGREKTDIDFKNYDLLFVKWNHTKCKDVVRPGRTSHEAGHRAVNVRSPRPQGEVRRRFSFANGIAFTAPGFKDATILVTLGEASVAGSASEGVAASAQSSVFFTLAASLPATLPPSSLCFAAAAKRVRAPSWYRACRTSLHSSDPGRARCMPS